MISFWELAYKIKTEQEALEYAQSINLIAEPPRICPHDFYSFSLDKSKNRHGVFPFFRCCNKNETRHRLNILKNTIFDKTKLKISDVIKLLYCFCSNLKIYDIADQCELSRQTIIVWYYDLRNILKNHLNLIQINKIKGTGKIIEIDETHVSTRKYQRGRILKKEKIWVIGAYCRESGEFAFRITKRRNKTVINNFINDYVINGSTIVTDCWRGYNDMTSNGFLHFTVNHSENFIDPDFDFVHTQNIERTWREIKKYFHDNCSEFNLETYIYKFVFDKIYQTKTTKEKFTQLINILKVN